MAKRKADDKHANAILRDGGGRELFELLRRLPADADPALAAKVSLGLIRGSIAQSGCWSFGRNCQRLPAAVIRHALPMLAERARRRDHAERDSAIFLGALVDAGLDDAALERAWARALQALLDLETTYGWGSKQRKAKLAGLAADPEIVAATQAIAVGCEDAALDVLAVLCAEGSEASFDALMPHLQRAEDSGERLEWLRRLRIHADAESAPIQSFLLSIDRALARLSERSGAIELAASLGFGRPKVFWFDAYLGSTTLLMPNNVPLYQGYLTVDSRRPDWFSLSVTRLEEQLGLTCTAFSRAREQDDLGLGVCEAAELPAWLARAAAQLETEWTVSLRSSLRGKKRQTLERWLLSG